MPPDEGRDKYRHDSDYNCLFLKGICLLDHLRILDKTLNLAINPHKYPILFIDINLSFIAKMI